MEPSSPATTPTAPRGPAWLQFPRQALLLLIAYALCAGLLLALRAAFPPADWSTSAVTGQPVAELVAERLPVTLSTWLAALVGAAPLALISTLFAVAVRRLRAGTPAAGRALGCLGRLAAYGLAALPPFALALLFFYLLVFALNAVSAGSLTGGLPGVLLAALLLALFPALAAALAAVEVLAQPGPAGRRAAAAVLAGLAALLVQTGGILSGLVAIETVWARPGVGRLLVDSVLRRDVAVFFGALLTLAGLVLAARLLAALLNAAARLAAPAIPAETAAALPARQLGVALSLALLLLPLVLYVGGLATPAERALEQSLADRNLGPEAGHPWGTDSLGRDVLARVLRGTVTTLSVAAGAALAATLVGGLAGAVTAALARRGQLWSESLADGLLLPLDAWLLLPAIPAAMLVVMVFEAAGPGVVVTAVGLALLPRVTRAAHALWLGTHGAGRRVIAAGVGLFLAAVFGGVWVLVGLELLGLGARPPAPSLGGLLSEALQFAARQPVALLAPIAVLWLSALGLYAAAVALMERVRGRAAAGWINA